MKTFIKQELPCLLPQEKKLKDNPVFPIGDDNATEFINPVTGFSL